MKQTNARSLVQPLFDGAIDIVGDVHGEIDALKMLLNHLGYAANGSHPEGRKLVFLGDLTDRGPDSPAVVELVKTLVNSGCAQCVLGNHDLNILLEQRKHDNRWFFGTHSSLEGRGGPTTPAVLADDDIRRSIRDFFASLPLALERHDVRVVHACWDDAMIEVARQSTNVASLNRKYASKIKGHHKNRRGLDKIDRGLEHQNKNPVKVLTSGHERRVNPPFWAGGKLHHGERVRWWESYDAESFCVFGHYSKDRREARPPSMAFCTDFAVAKRWQERKTKTKRHDNREK